MADLLHLEEGEPGLRCPECGSRRVRRSAPRSAAERLVRAVTPLHRFRCRDCAHRGWHLGAIPSRRHRDRELPAGRPLERRDIEAKQLKRKRLVSSVLVAVALGAAAGVYVHDCRQRLDTIAPTSP